MYIMLPISSLLFLSLLFCCWHHLYYHQAISHQRAYSHFRNKTDTEDTTKQHNIIPNIIKHPKCVIMNAVMA